MKKIVITLLISFSFIGYSNANGSLEGTWVFSEDKSMALASKSPNGLTPALKITFQASEKMKYIIQGNSWISELGDYVEKAKFEIISQEGNCYRFKILEANGKKINREAQACRYGNEFHQPLGDGAYLVFINS